MKRKAKDVSEDSVAKKVRKILSERPSIADCLRLGIVNYSALSRMVSDELKISNNEAVLSAIKRYHESLDKLFKDPNLRKIAGESTIELRPDVAILVLPVGSDWRKFESSLSIRDIVQGPTSTNVIFDERSLTKVDSSLIKGIEVRRGLASIIIKRPPVATLTPGVVVYFLSSLASAGINVEETLTCNQDQLILLKLEDAQRAFALLNELIRASRE